MNDSRDRSIAPLPVVSVVAGASDHARFDSVAVEAPLEVRLNGKATTVLMRTPGGDEELVRGFLFGEGMIAAASDIVAIDWPGDVLESERGNVIDVRLRESVRARTLDRLFFSNSSCGVCGKRTLESIAVRAAPSESKLSVPRSVLTELPEKLRNAQSAFAQTGGVHASALFTASGGLVALREDVGRHNALDKLVGWALAEGRVPLSDFLLLVSGRASYEIIQKAACAGLPIVAAIGAPSSLAVELAKQFHLTLVGFLKAKSLNVYANGDRLGD
jgi:FdhD protein